MKPPRQNRLVLELLEARDCPSLSVQLLGSSLLITGTPAGTTGLTIQGTGGKYSVTDGATVKGTFGATNISMNLDHYNEPITINLGGQTLGGNVLMSLGTGNLSPTLGANSVTIDNGTVGGSITVVNGSRNETLQLGHSTGTLSLHVGGNVTVSSSIGSAQGQFFLYDTSSIGGQLLLNGVPNVEISELNPGTGATVGGAVTVSDARTGSPLSLAVDGLSVLKSLTVYGSPLSGPAGKGDSVVFSSGVAGKEPTVQGNTLLNLGEGVNTWKLGGFLMATSL
jgi:hypothetical protein